MKALVINGHIRVPKISEGRLNQTIFDESKKALQRKGYEILETVIDLGYEVPHEIEKWVAADFILLQFPVNWFGMPAKTKGYMDAVLTNGYGKIYAGDGRNNGGTYGSGGLLRSEGMIVNTWNAPKEIFGNEGQMLGDISIEDFTRHFHATLQFVGVRPLPSFSFYDVYKNPTVEADLKVYQEHLSQHI